MSPLRVCVLVFGPIPIIVGSLAISRWLRPDLARAFDGNHAVTRASSELIDSGEAHPLAAAAARGGGAAEPSSAPAPAAGRAGSLPAGDGSPAPANHPAFAERAAGGANASGAAQGRLAEACQRQEQWLADRLGDHATVLIRPPFVLAGNLTQAELERWHRATIQPAARAMADAYFDTPPDAPIAVVLLADEESYQAAGRALFGEPGETIFGYYNRSYRALVLNLATGGGTLVHELTHALVDFDFPRIPDWFNEGLASLHEQCHIAADGSAIVGQENWRLPILERAIRSDRLRRLESLVADDDFRQGNEGVNYAQARYLCLWLERQGLLAEFYRRFRARQAADPQGRATLAELFPHQTLDDVDAQFRRWVLDLRWSGQPLRQ